MGKVLSMEDRYRTCCNCWHIRAGTIVLGLIEMVAVSIILSSIIRQLRWKTIEQALCSQKRWRDCLNFRNFNLTMAGDYIIAIVLFSIIFCIILLFYGVLTCRPRFLLPHLIVQGIGLILSFSYFILYAWAYFYGDLYVERKEFVVEQCIERMWLSAIILVFAIFQCYLFFSVIKCSLYLNKLKLEQQRRFMQFEEVSNRVKLAKENGLWRSTSWGGSFQQYRGQYEKKPKKPEEKKNLNNRVQWNLDKNVEKSISCTMDSSLSTTIVDETENMKVQENEHLQSPKSKSDELSHKQQRTSQSIRNFAPSVLVEPNNNSPSISRSSSQRMSGSSKMRRSRESESSNNSSFRGHQNTEIRRQNSNSDSPPSKRTPKEVAIGNTSASAVIYTKIGTQVQKPLPQAIVRLRPTKFPTFDSAETDKNTATKTTGRQRHSSHGSLRGSRKNREQRRQQIEDYPGSVNSTEVQTTVPRVKKTFIASKTYQTQSSVEYCQ